MSGIMAEHSNLNFEVVVDRNGELVHLYRANNVSGFPWTKTVTFGEGLAQPALIFNPATTNLEVLAKTPDVSSGGADVGGSILPFVRVGTGTWSPQAAVTTSAFTGAGFVRARNGARHAVVPSAGGVVHFRSAPGGSGWTMVGTLGSRAPVIGASVIQGNFATDGPADDGVALEAVVSDADGLTHHWFDGRGWHRSETFAHNTSPTLFPLNTVGDSYGAPVMIQSRFGTKGNFEVVVPLTRTNANPFGSSWKGLAHFFRNNDSGALPWTRTALFADGDHGRIGLLHSTQFNALEVVTWDGASLRAYFRANQGWQGGSVVATP